MAIDKKYGRVTVENGNIGDDEPVVVFRAQDALLPKLLAYYHLFCLRAGSPRHHLSAVLDARDAVVEWQETHRSKVPTSDRLSVPALGDTREQEAPDA